MTHRRPMGTLTRATCSHCGEVFEYASGTRPRIYCSRRCKKRGATWRRPAGYENHRRRAKAAGVEYEPIRKQDVYERDGWVCGICLLPVDPALRFPDPMSASLDHVVPLAAGGPHRPHNVRLAHHRCNTVRGAAG